MTVYIRTQNCPALAMRFPTAKVMGLSHRSRVASRTRGLPPLLPTENHPGEAHPWAGERPPTEAQISTTPTLRKERFSLNLRCPHWKIRTLVRSQERNEFSLHFATALDKALFKATCLLTLFSSQQLRGMGTCSFCSDLQAGRLKRRRAKQTPSLHSRCWSGGEQGLHTAPTKS